MKVVNIEKLTGHKRIVMTGREEHVELVASQLVESQFRDILYCPQREDYFLDYPDIIKDLKYRNRLLGIREPTVVYAGQLASVVCTDSNTVLL